MNIYYAGIGSRKTPHEILDIFTQIGAFLAAHGYILRSGAADGADDAFEKGCDMVHGQKEIYLPWKGFNHSESPLYEISSEAYNLAIHYNPAIASAKSSVKNLMARNGYQILGKDLKTPVRFVICYTPNGDRIGGTAQALRIAMDLKIPVFNAGNYNGNIELLKKEFNEFYKKWRV